MTAKPNKMGRIEAAPKVKKPLPWKAIGTVVAVIALIGLGVGGTLRYQQFIASVQAEGVAAYQNNNCEKFSDKDHKATWLECDAQRAQ